MNSHHWSWAAALMAGLGPAARISQGQVAGALDLSFNPAAEADFVDSQAVQPDGRILVGGSFGEVNGQPANRIARLDDRGYLESPATFNPFGSLTSFAAECLAVQPDGKIVVGGYFMVARRLANGPLDPSFNPGLLVTTVPSGLDRVTCMALQPNGKILVAGRFPSIGGVARRDIARLNADGTVDLTFYAGSGTNSAWIRGLALQPDGKILMAGQFTTVIGQPRRGIARLFPDGSVESTVTFNANITNSGTPVVYAVAVQPDGKILIAGNFTAVNGVPRANLARLEPNGALDTTTLFNQGPGPDGECYSLALQTDGKLVVCGSFTTVNGQPRSRIARFLPDGALESTATFDAGAGSAVKSATLQADGKIVVSGSFQTVNGQLRKRLARLTNDPADQYLEISGRTRVLWMRTGSAPETPRASFELSTDNGANWTAMGPVKRVPGGWEWTGPPLPSIVSVRARGPVFGNYENNSSGMIESVASLNFDTAVPGLTIEQPAGNALTDGGAVNFGRHLPGTSAGRTFTLRNSGSLGLTDISMTMDGPDKESFTLTALPVTALRPGAGLTFHAGFTPASTGARTAVLHIASNDPDENPFDLTLTGEGTNVPADIAVEQPAGTEFPDGGGIDFGAVLTESAASRTFVIKNTGGADLTGLTVTKDGVDEALFTVTAPPAVSGGGSSLLTVQFSPVSPGRKTAVLHLGSNDPDESPFDIVLTGRGVPSRAPAGGLDLSFAGTGKALVPNEEAAGTSLALQSDGKILVGGYMYIGGQSDFALVRWCPDGSLDTTFNGTGVATADFGAGDSAHGMAIQSDGKIVLAGINAGYGLDGFVSFALARWHADGRPDTGFNDTGKIITPFGTRGAHARSVALQSDGKIVVGGTVDVSPSWFALTRYTTDGRLDETFAGQGKTLMLPVDSGNCEAVAVQSDGLIVASGQFTGPNGNGFATVRFLPNGDIDSGFGNAGAALTLFDGHAGGHALALQNDGRIVVAGMAGNVLAAGTDRNFAVARYHPNGSVDHSFAGAGWLTAQVDSTDDEGYALALQSDGKILVAGNVRNGSEINIGVMRFLPNGTPDPDFGNGGRSVIELSGDDNAWAVKVQSDGKILVAGSGEGGIMLLRLLGSSVPRPEMVIEQPAGVFFPAGNTADFGALPPTGSRVLTFAARNAGYTDLTGLSFTLSGPGSGTFTLTPPASSGVIFGESAAFSVRFAPGAAFGPQTATLEVHSNDPDADANPFVIHLTGSGRAAVPSDAWRMTWFGTLVNEGPAADLSDPDGDGIVNLMEFATGGSPLAPAAMVVTLVKNGEVFEWTCPRRTEALVELNYLPQFADDPAGPWITAGAGAETIVSDSGGMQTVKVTVPAGPSGHRFVRLKVARK